MYQKHPRQSADHKMLIQKHLEAINSTVVNEIHVTVQPPSYFGLHFIFLQVNTDKTSKLFEMIILQRSGFEEDAGQHTSLKQTDVKKNGAFHLSKRTALFIFRSYLSADLVIVVHNQLTNN